MFLYQKMEYLKENLEIQEQMVQVNIIYRNKKKNVKVHGKMDN